MFIDINFSATHYMCSFVACKMLASVWLLELLCNLVKGLEFREGSRKFILAFFFSFFFPFVTCLLISKLVFVKAKKKNFSAAEFVIFILHNSIMI